MSAHRILLASVLACLLSIAVASGASAGPEAPDSFLAPHEAGDDEAPAFAWDGSNMPSRVKTADADDGALANAALRQLVRESEQGIAGPSTLSMSGNRVRVEVLSSMDSDQVADVVAAVGGEVYGEVPGYLAEALVPVDRLAELASAPGIDYVRPPVNVGVPIGPEPSGVSAQGAQPQGGLIVGQEVTKMNADAWHDAGFSGQDVRVGIIDGFDGATWNAAQGAGELPEPAGEFCRYFGSGCDLWTAGVAHGQGVAEIIHEMAPSAQLYVATVYSASDLQAAVDYFDSQGVDIISRSETAAFDGPGDGTGPIAAVVDDAIARGMLWNNAAGNNSSSDPTSGGSYWRGGWTDPDGNGVLNFDGDSEVLPLFCGFLNGLRWNDWGANPTDYDVYIYDTPLSPDPKVAGEEWQTLGAPPLELVNQEEAITCTGPADEDGLIIVLADPGSGTGGDVLELMGNATSFLYSQNPYSAGGPMSDSANPGMLSVGAVDPPLGTSIASYSSWGPTNDGRTKPDLSAASCVASFTYAPECFNGTSAATPAVTGAAALVLGAGLAGNPVGLANYLRASTVERGAGGTDNVFGTGEVVLGDPPSGGPTPAPTPEPTPTPNDWYATDFEWFQNVTPLSGTSECNHSKPVPPNDVSSTGPCVNFELNIPAGTYGFGVLLEWNGQIVIDDEVSQHLESGPDWELGFEPPFPDGSYHLELYADGVFLGETDLLVGNAPTPTPTPVLSPPPGGTSEIWGNTDCGPAMNLGDSIAIARSLVDLPANQQSGCPTIGSTVNVDGTDREWGDWSCNSGVNVGDAIALARSLVDLPVSQGAGCPGLGDTVTINA